MLESANSDPNFMNHIITGDESWVYGDDLETELFHHFTYNENPMRALNTTSIKCCLPLTDTIDRQAKIHACVMKVQGHLMQACFQPAPLILFCNHFCYAATCTYTLQEPAQN